MIYYRSKKTIKIAEIWYNSQEKLEEKKADVFKYKFVEAKQQNSALLEERFTILINLKEDIDTLFSHIGKNTRYKINRAKERDGVNCGVFFALNEQDKDKIAHYIEYFNGFSASKKRSSLTFSDLRQFYDQGTLCIRHVVNEDASVTYTMHAYIVSDGRARLHQSSSHFRNNDDSEARNLIGRANRYLHWDDILYFKNMGLDYYDFGGWYGGQTDTEKLAINQFKEAFGGEKTQEYTYTVPVSLSGKIAVFFQNLRKTKKSI